MRGVPADEERFKIRAARMEKLLVLDAPPRMIVYEAALILKAFFGVTDVELCDLLDDRMGEEP